MDILQKIKNLTNCLSRSLEVIQTDTDRSAVYDFLLVIHSNRRSTSCGFFEIKNDSCKILPPRVCNAPAEGLSLEFCNKAGAQKLR